MQKINTTTVIAFPSKNETHPDEVAGPSQPSFDIVAAAISPVRAQIRVPLNTLDEAELGLVVLQAAVEKSLAQIARVRRSRDEAALVTVRALLEQANRRINSKHRGR